MNSIDHKADSDDAQEVQRQFPAMYNLIIHHVKVDGWSVEKLLYWTKQMTGKPFPRKYQEMCISAARHVHRVHEAGKTKPLTQENK